MIARPMLASMFVAGAITALKNTEQSAARAKKVTDRVVPLLQKAVPSAPIPTDPQTLVRINAGIQLGAAAMLASGKVPRISSAVLAGSLVPTTLAGHAFWEETDPATKASQRLQFFKNVSAMGGLMLAAVDTEGKPGVAWRTQRAARDARKGSARLAKSARREAKLAKAQLT